MSLRKTPYVSQSPVDDLARSLKDVLDIGARSAAKLQAVKKRTLQETKQKKAIEDLKSAGLLDGPDDAKVKRQEELEAQLRKLNGIKIGETGGAQILWDNSQFVKMFLPAPMTKSSLKVMTWISINRALEQIGILDAKTASEFYAAATTHLFYIEQIENSKKTSNSRTVPMTPMDISASIGVDFEPQRAGKRFESEWSVDNINVFSSKLVEGFKQNYANTIEYIKKVGRGIEGTYQAYKDRGLESAFGKIIHEGSDEVQNLISTAIKGIWDSITSIGPGDIFSIVIDVVLPLIVANRAQTTTTAFADDEERETVERLNRHYDASQTFFSGTFGSLVFKAGSAIDQATGWFHAFRNEEGLPANSIDDASQENMIQLGLVYDRYMYYTRSAMSSVTGGYLGAEEDTSGAAPGATMPGVGSPGKAAAYDLMEKTWRLSRLITKPNAAIPWEISLLLFHIITSAITQFASVSSERIKEWSKLNGDKLRNKMVRVLRTHVDLSREYAQKLKDGNIRMPNALSGQSLETEIVDEIDASIVPFNTQWKKYTEEIKNAYKTTSVGRARRGGLLFGGLEFADFVGSVTSVTWLQQLKGFRAMAVPTMEIATFMYWRSRLYYKIEKIGESIDKFQSNYLMLTNNVNKTHFEQIMAAERKKWKLQKQWPGVLGGIYVNPNPGAAAGDNGAGALPRAQRADDDDDDYQDDGDYEDDDEDYEENNLNLYNLGNLF